MNFGAFATPERNVIFDINDFDDTLPAPFEWDLKRLAASAVIAAQHLRLPQSDAARAAIDCARAYREHIADSASMHKLDVWHYKIDLQRYEDRTADPQIVAEARKRFAQRLEKEQCKTVPDHLYPKLVSEEGARTRIKDDLPLIFHPTAKMAGIVSGYAEVIAAYRESLPEHTRMLFDRFHPPFRALCGNPIDTRVTLGDSEKSVVPTQEKHPCHPHPASR